MKIYRNELISEIDKKLFEINVDEFSFDNIEFFSEIIDGSLIIDNMSNSFHVKGILNVPYKLLCDRCLTNFNESKKINFDIILTDNDQLNYDDSDDIIYFSINENEFDLNPLFQELIQLEIQMKTICSSDCKGLCSNCGTNLNIIHCYCDKDQRSNTWDVLKNLEGK